MKRGVIPKWEDERNGELVSLLDELKNENINKIAEKKMEIRNAEKDRFELECLAVVEKYENMFIVRRRESIDDA